MIKERLEKNIDSEQRIINLRSIGIIIGKDVFIDANVWIEGVYPGMIEIEDNVIISIGAKIICHDSSLSNLYGLPVKVKKVTLKRNCYIGAGAIILPGVTVNEKGIVGAGSVVTKDVSKETVVAGNPAVFISTTKDLIRKYRKLIEQNPDSFDHMKSPYYPGF